MLASHNNETQTDQKNKFFTKLIPPLFGRKVIIQLADNTKQAYTKEGSNGKRAMQVDFFSKSKTNLLPVRLCK